MFSILQTDLDRLIQMVEETTYSITLIANRPLKIDEKIARKHQIVVSRRKVILTELKVEIFHWQFNARIITLLGILKTQDCNNSRWYFVVDRENPLSTEEMRKALQPTFISLKLSESQKTRLKGICDFFGLQTIQSGTDIVSVGGPRFNILKFLKAWREDAPIFFFQGDAILSTAEDAFKRLEYDSQMALAKST